ncbi:MAG TPA: hypothetical protein VFP84_40970 [Kofleriaceae bacterium]|nr:hypothetical protein [Kofleriaceae bacterium]
MAQVKIPRTIVGIVREASRLLADPPLAIWTLFVFMIPFYVFNSGLPQPGDVLVLPLVAVTLWTWKGRLDRRARRPFMSLVIFTLWVIAVDWGWALLLGNFGLFGPSTFLLFPVYYIYNAFVFLVVCVLYQRYGTRFLWLTLHIVLFTVIVQALATLVVHRAGHGPRGSGFFNNPNQLGFFALVMASVLALGKRNLGFGAIKSGLGITTCFYLALVSASRAAVIGCALLFAFSILSNPRRILVVGLIGLGLGALGGPIFEALDRTHERLTNDHFSQLTFFEERGYDRILNHKEYWALGAGEGGTDRFAETTKIGATEIHSSIGTLFFSYGVVGIVLFAVFLFRVARGAKFRQWIILLPALSYTIAHQGLRSTPVWILFAVFVCFKQMQAEQRKHKLAARAAKVTPAPVAALPEPA